MDHQRIAVDDTDDLKVTGGDDAGCAATDKDKCNRHRGNVTHREAEADAVRRLPDLTSEPSKSPVQATGTEDNRAATRGDEQAQRARNISVRSRSSSFVRDGDKHDARNPLETSSPSVEMRDDSSPCAKATFRTRTGDLRFTKPLLYQLS